MLQRLLILSVFLQCCLAGSAQTTLSGKVTDDRLQPVSAASLVLVDSKDTTRKWFTVSDSSGFFVFKKIGKGLYRLQATGTGYKPGEINSIAIRETTSHPLPDIIFGSTSDTLQEVVVQAKNPPVEIDKGKLVFNVQGMATTSGLTAFDLLKRLPGVTVDQDENIQLRGSSGLNVLVNGKMTYLSGIQLTTYLKGISAEDINKIELNAIPASEFDAAGNGGIINIALKRNLQKGYAVDIRSGISKGKFWMANENISASYRMKKLVLYGSLDYKMPCNEWNSSSGNTIEENGQKTVLKRESRSVLKAKYYTWHTGAEWQLSSRHQLSFDYHGYFDDWRNGTYSVIRKSEPGGNMLSSVYSYNDLNEPYHYDAANINYRFDIDSTGKKITAETHYISYRNYSDGNLATQVYDISGNPVSDNTLLSHQPGFIQIRSANADAELPFPSFTLKAGLKYAEVSNDNAYHFDSLYNGIPVVVEEMSNHFKYKERIAASYISASKKIRKTSIDAGIRIEYTKSDGYTIKQDVRNHWEYTKPFPTLSIEQEITTTDKMSFSVSRRINRPSYGQLNPVRWYTDQYFYYAGNPNLVPEMAWVFSTAYTFKSKYVFTVSYGHNSNYINRRLVTDSNGVSIKSEAANLGTMHRLDLIASLPLQILSFWNMQFMPDISYMDYPISQQGGEKMLSRWFATVSLQQQLKLPAGIRMDISTQYYSAGLRGIYITRAGFYTDIGIKRSILKNKLDMQVTFSDIFNTYRYQGSSQSNITDYYYNDKSDTRRLGITLHYHLGSDLIKGSSRTTEEQNRL